MDIESLEDGLDREGGDPPQPHSTPDAAGEFVPVTLPPFVYALCTTNEKGEIAVAYHITKDGKKALLAYTAFDRLIENAGSAAMWALLSMDDLEKLKHLDHYDIIFQDLFIPEEAR